MEKQYLGILVNDSLISEIQSGKLGHEKLEFYELAGKKFDFIPCYFRLTDISLYNKKVVTYVNQSDQWIRKTISLPRVIHNRAIYHTIAAYRKLTLLSDLGIPIFNFWNRYGKLYIAKLLQDHKELRLYHPVTLPFATASLQNVQTSFSSFLLKPDKGSVGEGILKVERKNHGIWEISYRNGRSIVKEQVPETQLYKKLKGKIGSNKYLIQEIIPLATYDGSPFDIRISVQKNGNGIWEVTGMVGKVAKRGHFLSNVAQGAKVYPLAELLQEYPQLQPSAVMERLSTAALAITDYLGEKLPHLADVGYDFGIDIHGRPYFIEVNSRDQRYSFAKAKMFDIWRKTYENPVAYARFLLNRKGVE